MSHSSGIPVGTSLKDSFGELLKGSLRAVKAHIEETEIVTVDKQEKKGSLEEDLSWIIKFLEKDRACYVIVRLDSDTPKFVLFCYVPDKSKVREKMLYASTRSNLKLQLGANYFVDEVFGTVESDFTPEGYKQHKDTKKMEAPLTDSEKLKQSHIESGEIYSGGASTYVHGVAFPVDSKVMDAVTKLKQGGANFVQVAIDCDKERIICDEVGTTDFEGLKKKISTTEPRFYFFSYAHNFDGQDVSSIVFIYSCPDGSNGTKSAPVRMRMLYSSSKSNVAEVITKVGGTVGARLEVNTSDEIEEENIMTLLHPQQEQKKETFAKPSRNVKGGRRIIKQ